MDFKMMFLHAKVCTEILFFPQNHKLVIFKAEPEVPGGDGKQACFIPSQLPSNSLTLARQFDATLRQSSLIHISASNIIGYNG